MSKAVLLLVPSLLLLLSSSAPAELPKRYDLLNRKSIFAKDRVARSGYTRSMSRPTAQPSSSPILIGIIDDEGSYIAVLETPGAGILTPVRLGEMLPGNAGTVTAITLDYVEFTPAPRLAATPAAEPTTLPTTEPATLASTQPATLPAAEPAIEPTTLPSTQPATPPATELAIEPTTEPTTRRTEDVAPAYAESAPAALPTTRRILIGHNLQGAQVLAPASASDASSSSTTAPIEGDDIVSRMRRRRQQESGK